MSSILFDDLNDQEFNEALEDLYKAESESKATNLFEQSFEDRLESNRKLISEDTEYFLLEEEMKRSQLPDSVFGVPEQRKYPLDSEKHVRSAIKLFNYVDPKYEAELAKKIKRKMKQYNITDINVGEANRFSKYYNASKKAVNEGWLVLDSNNKWTLSDNFEDYEKYYDPEKLNESYYTKKDIVLTELGEFLTESSNKIKYIEKDSKIVKMPKVCPKCGSKMGIFIKGEPVCLCTNKDCNYYAGTVCFDQKEAAKKFNESAEALQEFNKDVEAYYKVRDVADTLSGDHDHYNYKQLKAENDDYRDNGTGKVKNKKEKEERDAISNGAIKDAEEFRSERNFERNLLKSKGIKSKEAFRDFVANTDYDKEYKDSISKESAVLSESDNEETMVRIGKDKVKGKPSPLSSTSVKSALEAAAEIPDPKKRSAKLREIISSTIGKLSAKIKHIFGNLKLYDDEYTYDGYIREIFPKYLDMMNAKDLYKLKQSIMEHAFTTGRGHKSLKDVLGSNQMASDKDNYLYNLADKVRRDLSVLLHTIDAKYEKARFDGAKPYQKEEEVEEPTPVKKTKDEDDDEDNEEEETPKKEEPKKKRKSYWDVDISEEEEEELSHDESAEVLEENVDYKQYKKMYKELLQSEPVKTTLNSWVKDSGCKDVDELISKMKVAWLDYKSEDKNCEAVYRFTGVSEDSDLKEKLFVIQYNPNTEKIKVSFRDDNKSTNESALNEGFFAKRKEKKLIKKNSGDISRTYNYINSKMHGTKFYHAFPKDSIKPKVSGNIIEFVAGYISLPELYKNVYGNTLSKVIESQKPATKIKARLNEINRSLEGLKNNTLDVYFEWTYPENFYIDNKDGNMEVVMYDFSSAPQLVVKEKAFIATKESTDEILEEKAKIKSEEPDDAGYFESNLKFKGAKVVVCSRYQAEAEAQIKSINKSFKNIEKSYSNILESVANEIYNDWSKDHGEKLSRKDFAREVYKSKLQNRIIAYQDDYGYVFEFNYSINPVIGGRILHINIYTDLDGYVSSYKYELESSVRRY